MWKLVGMTVLLIRAVMANMNEEDSYYLTETDDGPSESLENPRETTLEYGTLKATSSSEDESDEDQSENGSLPDYSKLKMEPKRSIVHVDLRDGRSEHRKVPAPLATLLYWPHRQDQVIGMGDSRNPLPQSRRSFSPWGGKRDMERYRTITKIRRPVRVPFNSWGGKRSGEPMRLRKLSDPTRDFLSWEGKKSPPFNSWGGKRASVEFPVNEDPSGKISFDLQDRGILRESKNKKTANDFRTYDLLRNPEQEKGNNDEMFNNETQAKRGSLKLIESSEITTSSSTMGDHFSRVPFEPWGGKRRGELRFGDDDPATARVSLIFRKIGETVPWTV